ncbi:zinc-binding dehydrogenase [Planctomycetota bacterium]
MMKAVTIRKFEGPEMVQVEEVAEPQISEDEVLLEVKAAALNHLDIWVTKDRRGPELKIPHVLGADASGVVAAIGARVDNVSIGQEVLINPGLSCSRCEFCRQGQQSLCSSFGIMGFSRPGTFVQRVAVPAANVYPKPAHLDFTAAAALPLDHLTAWRMLMARGKLQSGQTILIHGIGGGAALAGLQFARLVGARIIATSSSDEKLSRAAELGAAHLINYHTASDLTAEVLALTGDRGVDLIFDSAGAATWGINEKVIRRGGTIVLCGVTTGAKTTVNLQRIYWNQLNVLGSTMGSHEDFRSMLQAVSVNKIKPVIDTIFPLDQASSAFMRMEKGEQFGKIVLDMSK